MAIRKKHFFRLPWNASIDLFAVSAIGIDGQGRMSAQMYGGGFQRGPVDACTPAVVAEIIEALEQLEGVEVTRSAQCAAEITPLHRATIPVETG